MKIHFIAIGGSVMHNLAIALHQKGYEVSGTDDDIFEPSRSRLNRYGLLPPVSGWLPGMINREMDAVIVGMHARPDNPELVKARKLGLKVYSYPEYLYEQSQNKLRVVIGGSHGKTTITAMIMHVLKQLDRDFDYMVGAQLEGFDTMVKLSHDAPLMIFEGDEYLSSPIDPRPKFHLYKPHIALITGIAWDHINVFPTEEAYIDAFSCFVDQIENNGKLIYFEGDKHLQQVVNEAESHLRKIAYRAHPAQKDNGEWHLLHNGKATAIPLVGQHNLQNIAGALEVCRQLDISDQDFYRAISSFKGASKRMQVIAEGASSTAYLDFAHAPSKVKATVEAVKQHQADRRLIACLELHTFSSLNAEFLDQYRYSMNLADQVILLYNPDVVSHKKLPELSKDIISKAFGHSNLTIVTTGQAMSDCLKALNWQQTNLLLMSSGNFDRLDIKILSKELFRY